MHSGLFIFLISSKLLKLSICTALILDYYSLELYHCLITIYKNKHKQWLMEDFSTIKLQTPSINQRPKNTYNPSPIPPSYGTASSIPDSLKIHPKYLNSNRFSNRIPSTWTTYFNPSSPFSTITLHWLSDLFFYKFWQSIPPLALSFSDSLHKTKSSAYKRLHNLHSLLSSLSPFSPSLHLYIHWKLKGTWYTPVSHHYRWSNTNSTPFVSDTD